MYVMPECYGNMVEYDKYNLWFLINCIGLIVYLVLLIVCLIQVVMIETHLDDNIVAMPIVHFCIYIYIYINMDIQVRVVMIQLVCICSQDQSKFCIVS